MIIIMLWTLKCDKICKKYVKSAKNIKKKQWINKIKLTSITLNK